MSDRLNERIDTLAAQAFQYASEHADESGKGSLGVFAEKFAELIIGKCTETVRQVLREEGSTLSYEDCSKIQKQMKDYFGVK